MAFNAAAAAIVVSSKNWRAGHETARQVALR
jgi:hypothetical protein